jgi:hypothetical protein
VDTIWTHVEQIADDAVDDVLEELAVRYVAAPHRVRGAEASLAAELTRYVAR